MSTPTTTEATEPASLVERAALTAGANFWETTAYEALGIRSVRVTDGPNGPRGAKWGTEVSTCVPCGTSLAASWDPELVRQVGVLLGVETRARGAQVLLAPTVNLHRHPYAGRNFECYSEDPVLTSEIAVAYVSGVQSTGVACTVKHFAANDQERGRMSLDVLADARTLRELYLLPFEAVVKRAGVWAVMAAYNKVLGSHCSQNKWLLADVLKGEWGFDGLVMSDWFGTHAAEALAAGLDLEMPGPAVHLGTGVAAALEGGQLARSRLRDANARLVRLVKRVSEPVQHVDVDPDLTTVAAAAGAVLLRNDGVLPLTRTTSVAVIGPFADLLTIQGGGSAEVTTRVPTGLVDALTKAGASVSAVQTGIELAGVLPMLDPRTIAFDGVQGALSVEYRQTHDDAELVGAEIFRQSRMLWVGTPDPRLDPNGFSVRVRTTFTPPASGSWRLGVTSLGSSVLLLDGEVVVDELLPTPEAGPSGGGAGETLVELVAGTSYELEIRYHARMPALPIAMMQVGASVVAGADALEKAVQAAAAADVALVVVGSDGRFESEGNDRESLELPGRQAELIRAVAAANPRTVVVVNTGAVISMDWADEVAAVLQLWFPGQDGDRALTGVLLGDLEPGGRLPTTIPYAVEDSPSHAFYPGEGVGAEMSVPGLGGEGGTVRYEEGLFMGYRGYDRDGREPRFCFGHGLSYTSFEYGEATVETVGDEVELTVDVTNTGSRPGSEVVQVYVRQAFDASLPPQELKAFAKKAILAGATETVRLRLDSRAFAHWDQASGDWTVAPGSYELAIGASSRDIRRVVSVVR